MTVFIYVNTRKQVGDAEHLKVFANVDAAEKWFEENDPKASRSNMKFWNERGRQLRRPDFRSAPGARNSAGAAALSTSSSSRIRVDFSHIARGQRH